MFLFINRWLIAILLMNTETKNIFIYRVAFIFGSITMISGIIGVPLGAYLAQRLRKKHQRADPVICGFGLLISAPCIVAAMLLVSVNAPAAYCLIFIGEIALNLNWAIVADILLVRINFLSIFFRIRSDRKWFLFFQINFISLFQMILLNHTFSVA